MRARHGTTGNPARIIGATTATRKAGTWYLDPIDPEPGALLDRAGAGCRTLHDAARVALEMVRMDGR